MFKKVLLANRGEIACRVIRTLKKMGIGSVAVYSDADAQSAHVSMADEAICIGPGAAAESYLRGNVIIETALKTGAQAIHPGYGFLSENPEFATMCDEAGIVFIGPTPEQMRSFGLKHTARDLAQQCGVPMGAGLRPARLARRCDGGGEDHRLPGHAQSHRRRRRDRHAPLPRGKRAGRSVRHRAAARQEQFQTCRAVSGKIHRAGRATSKCKSSATAAAR